MNTNPAPERTWSLSSEEVKALSHASGSDFVYALTKYEVREWMHELIAAIAAFTHSACSTLSPGPPSPSRGVLQLH